MCVIAYQTTRQAELTYDEIKNMARKNPHGMGWMAIVNGKVIYQKGYFNVDDLYKDYKFLYNKKDCTEIALHFRIGTGSKIDVANCHPFPITNDTKKIKSSHGDADVCIMMNGIIGASTKEFSDTALYVMNNLEEYYENDDRFWLHFDKKDLMLFENEINGNRFVFMSGEGSKLFGNGWSDYKGKCQVSNRYWIPFSETKTKTDFRNQNQNWNRFYTKSGVKHKSYIDYIMDEVAR